MSNDWNPNDPDAVIVQYDLSRWTFDQQAELASELAEGDVPHTWDGAELIVPEAAEGAADAAIEAVEIRLDIPSFSDEEEGDDDGQDDESPTPEPITLEPGVPSTEYDLSSWEADERELVTTALVVDGIPFRWDGTLLLVPVDKEAEVDAVLDGVENGDIVFEADEEAERLPFETLTTFFLAAERLQRNATSADGLEQLMKALEVADPSAPPYGVNPRLWAKTCELADELGEALAGGDEPDTDDAQSIAADLHDLLRPYV